MPPEHSTSCIRRGSGCSERGGRTAAALSPPRVPLRAYEAALSSSQLRPRNNYPLRWFHKQSCRWWAQEGKIWLYRAATQSLAASVSYLLNPTWVIQLHLGNHTARVKRSPRPLHIMDAARFCCCECHHHLHHLKEEGPGKTFTSLRLLFLWQNIKGTNLLRKLAYFIASLRRSIPPTHAKEKGESLFEEGAYHLNKYYSLFFLKNFKYWSISHLIRDIFFKKSL